MTVLENMVRAAWDRGASIDLTGAAYGRIHWDDKTRVSNRIMEYYRTLAGFAALTRSCSALEIGTHWGGSGVAILRGMISAHGSAARLVTIDKSTESDNYLPLQAEAPQIKKIVGMANELDVIKAVLGEVQQIDLLYVDADHSELPTLLNFCIYKSLLKPKIALFDDITLTDGMRSFWDTMRTAYPDHTINCVDVIADTRKPAPECGFGLFVDPEYLPTLNLS